MVKNLTLFKRIFFGIFLLIHSGIQVTAKHHNTDKNYQLASALLLAKLPLVKILQYQGTDQDFSDDDDGSVKLITCSVLEEMLASFDITPQLSREQLLTMYSKNINKRDYSVYSYERLYVLNSIDNEYATLHTKIEKKTNLLISEQVLENKKSIQQFVQPYAQDQKEAVWLTLSVAFELAGIALTLQQKKSIRKYIEARDKGKPYSVIHHFLREAGLDTELDLIFSDPKKVRLNHKKIIQIKMAHVVREKGFSFGKNMLLIMPMSQENRKPNKLSRIYYKDRLIDRNVTLRLRGFVLYDGEKYEAYHKEVTRNEVIYYRYYPTSKGWRYVRITQQYFEKKAKEGLYQLYEQVATSLDREEVPEEKNNVPEYRVRNLFTSFSLLGNLCLGGACFVLALISPQKISELGKNTLPPISSISNTFTPISQYDYSVDDDFLQQLTQEFPQEGKNNFKKEQNKIRKPAEPGIRGIMNEGSTCFFNSIIQVLGEFIEKMLNKKIMDDNKDVTGAKNLINDKHLDIEIQDKMSKTLREWVLSVIKYSRSPEEVDKRSTRDIIYLINAMKYVGNICSRYLHLPEAIKKAKGEAKSSLTKEKLNDDSHKESAASEAKNEALEEETLKKMNEIIEELESINTSLDKEVAMSTIVTNIEKLKNETNQLIQNLKKEWEGKGKEKLGDNNLKEIKTDLPFNIDNDAQEALKLLLDFLRIPRQIIQQTTNREDSDDLGLLDMGETGNTFTIEKQGEVRKMNLYLLPINPDKDPKMRTMSDALKTALEDNNEGENLDISLSDLMDILKECTSEPYKELYEKMQEGAGKITPEMCNLFNEYEQERNKRYNDKILKNFRKNREIKEKADKLPLNIKPNKKEEDAFQKLEESNFFATLKDIGVNNPEYHVKERDISIRPPEYYSGYETILQRRHIYYDKDDKDIKFSLKVTIKPDRLSTVGDYMIISPRIFKPENGTLKKVPHKIFPDKHLYFRKSMEPNAPKVRYERVGFINHIWTDTIHNGHYVAYKKIDGVWYYFSDFTAEIVGNDKDIDQLIDEEYHTIDVFGKKVVNPTVNTYIYLYRKVAEQ